MHGKVAYGEDDDDDHQHFGRFPSRAKLQLDGSVRVDRQQVLAATGAAGRVPAPVVDVVLVVMDVVVGARLLVNETHCKMFSVFAVEDQRVRRKLYNSNTSKT